jgi:cyanophycinase
MRTNRLSTRLALTLAPICLVSFTLAVRVSQVGPADSPASPREAPSGSLVLAGGGKVPTSVWNRFVELAGGDDARLVVIPTASEPADEGPLLPVRTCPCWDELYETRKVKSLVFLHTRRPDQANDPAFVRPLTEASGVWFGGGDQTRLTAAYHGTAVEREVKQVLARGGVVGGTSAGAAVMSAVMIRGGNPVAEVGPGFGLLPGVVIDQHFSQRQRLPRLQGVLAKYPRLGLGIDEETGVVVRGRSLTVLGNHHVHVCLPDPRPGAGEVRVLGSGDQIDLEALHRAAPSLVWRE